MGGIEALLTLGLVLAAAPVAAPDSRGEALSEAGAEPPARSRVERAHLPPSPNGRHRPWRQLFRRWWPGDSVNLIHCGGRHPPFESASPRKGVALRSRGPAAAQEHILLIGGGYDPDSAQAQIEQNVLWVSRLLHGRGMQRIYFDDGAHPAADVVEQVPLRGDALEPLRRLFASGHVAGYRYRNHAIPGVHGGTEVTALRAALEHDIARLKPGDRLLIVFNGHGTRSRLGRSGNRLWLWDGTSLDVREFDALLARVPSSVTVRFVFTQCYAGAFARLAPGPDGNRCGFLAESADRPAEGCAAGVDAGDYRDYTTYFFAALAGRTRLGGPLPVNPDHDGDGRVSFFEAHRYALRVGESADLPRSTSEDFLERWQPWYADLRRLFGFGDDGQPTNDYAWLARELAVPFALPDSDRALYRELRRLRAAEARQARAVRREQRALQRTIAALQGELRESTAARWPRVRQLEREGLPSDADGELGEIAAFVRTQSRYAGLVRAQDRHEANEQALLDGERRVTRFDKIERLRKLARLQDRFAAQASAADRATYEKLLACEHQGL